MPQEIVDGDRIDVFKIRGVDDPIPLTTASFTRPGDTAPYAANDVVCNSTSAPTLLEFPSAAAGLGKGGVIVSARHMKTGTTTAGATFRLQLYRVGTVTPINDNAQFAMLWANRANRVGFIDFTHQIAGTGSDTTSALTTYVGLPFVCNAATSSLFGVLTVTAAYTPGNAEQHYIELAISQN
jgi:hypothetical protein